MTLPRPRFTVRRLMVAVAVVAVMLGIATRLASRSEFYRLAAEVEIKNANDYAHSTEALPSVDINRARARLGWYVSKAENYSKVARRPWLPVAPDPPEPE